MAEYAPERSPTLRVIAAALGLSASTVSLALNDSPRLRESTRQRVREAARRLGYQRSGILSATLSSVRSGGRKRFRETVGCLSLTPEVHRMVQPGDDRFAPASGQQAQTRAFRAGLVSRAEELGCTLDFFCAAAQPMATLLRVLRARGIERLVLLGMDRDPLLFEPLRPLWEQCFVVSLGVADLPWVGGAAVQLDYFAAGQRVAREAWRRGYRGFLLDEMIRARSPDRRFEAGMRFALGYLAPEPSVQALHLYGFDQFNAREHIRRLPRDSCLVGGLFAHHPWLGEAIAAGESPGYIDWHANITRRNLAGLDQRDSAQARAAIDLVLGTALRSTKTTGPDRVVLIEPGWQDGETLPLRAVATRNLAPDTPYQPARGRLEPVDAEPWAISPADDSPWRDAERLAILEPGSQVYHGIPFTVTRRRGGTEAAFLSPRRPAVGDDPRGTRPVGHRVPLGGRVIRVFVLHACAQAYERCPLAYYRFRYHNGSTVEVPLVPLGRVAAHEPLPSPLPEAVNVQDWWPGFAQISTAAARPVCLFDLPSGASGNLYTLEWRNPHPRRTLQALEICPAKDTAARLAVLAVTVERT